MKTVLEGKPSYCKATEVMYQTDGKSDSEGEILFRVVTKGALK